MDDQELEQIRMQRLAQMQQQVSFRQGYKGIFELTKKLFQGGQNPEAQQKRAEQEQQQTEMKNSMLVQLLDQNARARLNTLKISKPEKAQMVEGMIIRMAQMGQIGGKLDDEQLKQLLESLNSQMPKSNSMIKFDRRRAAMDDSDDDYGM